MKKQIRDYLKKEQITQTQLADRLGVSVFSIANWRSGTAPQGKNAENLRKLGFDVPEYVRTPRGASKQKPKTKLPGAIISQIGSMMDEYVKQLGQEKTWAEFQEEREAFASKIFQISRKDGS